jgi:hypothetical protein
MVCIWAIMACFISMSLLAPACWASEWDFQAASAASFLAVFSVMVVFILAIGSAGAAGVGVAAGVSGVAVTVAAGVAVTVAAGAGVAGGVSGVAVTVAAGAAAGSTVIAGGAAGAGAGLAVTFWARMGRHIRDSAATNRRTDITRTEFGRFMMVLLGGALDVWWGVPPGSSMREGAWWDGRSSRKRHLPSLLSRESAA